MMSTPESGAAPGPARSGGEAHSHRFRVKMDPKEARVYILTCTRPCTVLEAIKSDGHCLDIYERKRYSDSTIMIEKGEGDKEYGIPTHFPCCLIDDNELVTLWETTATVAPQEQRDEEFLPPDKCSVFYIDTKGGLNAKSKTLFKKNHYKDFKYLCVYADKRETVEEALRRDGRFTAFESFTLSNNEKENEVASSSQKTLSVQGGKFKICLPRDQAKDKDKSPQAKPPKSERSKGMPGGAAGGAEQTSGSKVKTEPGRSSNTQIEEIYQRLCQQFPDLKTWMESRFPGDSLPKALKLKQENFGKIQQSFAEVHRLRQVMQRGESVCKITVGSVCEGTGFVLVGRYVLTNAHLFEGCLTEDNNLQSHIKVSATFNYETPEPAPSQVYHVKDIAVLRWSEGFDYLDYAVLELEAADAEVPPGLLGCRGPVPPTGEACMIGHPEGGVKKLDLTCVIEKEGRAENVASQLTGENMLIIQKVLEAQEIEKILKDGDRADQLVTYNAYMFHGSSGSPVFDAEGRVFGLHTRRYVLQCEDDQKGSVIECAQRLDKILDDLVGKLKGKPSDLRRRIEELLDPQPKSFSSPSQRVPHLHPQQEGSRPGGERRAASLYLTLLTYLLTIFGSLFIFKIYHQLNHQ